MAKKFVKKKLQPVETDLYLQEKTKCFLLSSVTFFYLHTISNKKEKKLVNKKNIKTSKYRP